MSYIRRPLVLEGIRPTKLHLQAYSLRIQKSTEGAMSAGRGRD